MDVLYLAYIALFSPYAAANLGLFSAYRHFRSKKNACALQICKGVVVLEIFILLMQLEAHFYHKYVYN